MKSLHRIEIPLKWNQKIFSKSTEFRIYNDVCLLTPGEYTDSISMVPILYRDNVMKKYATNWKSEWLNLDHSRDVRSRIGYVRNHYWNGKAIMGDLYIFPGTTAGTDTISLIDSGLINKLSVEVMSNDSWNGEEQVRQVDEMEFLGTGIVTEPADEHTYINKE